VDQEWSERDEAMYAAWAQTTWACPQVWVPVVGKQQEILPDTSPWYNVLSRAIFLETTMSRGRLVSDSECQAALVAYAEKFMGESRLQPESRFRIGEKVRLTTNLAQSRGLVNGMTGKVVGFLLNESSAYEWQTCNLRQMKRFMNARFADWFLVGDEWSGAEGGDEANELLLIDDQDVWTRALDVTSGPCPPEERADLFENARAVRGPSIASSIDLGSATPMAQIRATWFGSVLLSTTSWAEAGAFLWTDDPSDGDARGLPVVEWKTGSRTIVPMFDWSVDFVGLMGQAQGKRAEAKRQPRDRWQIHLY
jgi:hypothetical protein